MNLLAIDTSTERLSIAVCVGGAVYSEELHCLQQHAQLLLPIVEQLLAKARLTCSQLDGIVFGRGPGSFTGLRIACSVAKGLAYAHDLPLYPVSSLAAIANEVYHSEVDPHSNARILAMIDARMLQVYWGCFTRESIDVEEQVSAASDIVLRKGSPIILAGVGLESYVPDLPQTLHTQIITQYTVFPHATAMLRLVGSGQINAVSADMALPVYVRNQVTHGGGRG